MVMAPIEMPPLLAATKREKATEGVGGGGGGGVNCLGSVFGPWLHFMCAVTAPAFGKILGHIKQRNSVHGGGARDEEPAFSDRNVMTLSSSGS